MSEVQNDLKDLQLILQRNSIIEKELELCLDDVFYSNESKPATFKSQLKCAYDIMLPCFISVYHFIFIATKCSLTAIFILVLVYWLATTHNVTQKFIMRNSQNYIYPVMRNMRLLTLPIIRRYNSLTDWHEEQCLVKNPFYHEPSLDCWPCEDVRTMVDLTGLHNYSNVYVFNDKPFIVRDGMKEKFTFEDMMKLYKKYKIELERGTARFYSTKSSFQTLSELVECSNSVQSIEEFHVIWKVNRVAAARVLRKIFKRPYFVPNNSEVALQRFLCVSTSEAPQFFLPSTDFANVWIAQGQGYRLIVLDPSEPCQNNCSTLSVVLKPHDVLFYNWQFWKPRSLPARLSKDISITYVGSFY